jgi:hypothetical protein
MDNERMLGFATPRIKAASFAIVLILQARMLPAESWSTYQHDAAHTGRSTASFDPALLQKAWDAPLGYSTPLVVGNSIYAMKNGAGAGSTTYTSFNLLTGVPNWNFTHSYAFPSCHTFAEGLILFAAGATGQVQKLYVLDAASGTQKYTVDLPSIDSGAMMPTVARIANNQLMAYVADHDSIVAVNLEANSGTPVWAGMGSFGGQSIPTLVGDSVVLAGPGQFYAFRQATGGMNHFLSGNTSGGGGTTAAFDAARMQFYISETVGGNPGGNRLTAFKYTSNSNISQLWQIGGIGASVAIGSSGLVYAASNSLLQEIDPTNGNILRSLNGLTLANGFTPALSANSIFLDSEGTTDIYDINSLALLKSLPGSRGDVNTPYDSPGAVFDFGYVIDYGTILNKPGFDVYFVPEPGSLVLFSVTVALVAFRGTKKAESSNRIQRRNTMSLAVESDCKHMHCKHFRKSQFFLPRALGIISVRLIKLPTPAKDAGAVMRSRASAAGGLWQFDEVSP